MAVIYGVLRGKLDRWKREDVPPGSSKSPHLHVRLIDDGGTPWHLAVNGVFNDGGLLLRFPDHVAGLFFRFKTQFLPTDAQGNQIPGVSKEIPPAGSPVDTPPAPPPPGEPNPTLPFVYIERALLNPGGDDTGREIVVIGNTTVDAVDLTGWRVVDKNDAAETIGNVQLSAGGSALIVLSGQGAQLSNKGGTIRLVNPSGVLIHAVSYSKADAVDNRFVRFNT